MYHFIFERKVLPDKRFKRVWGVRRINSLPDPSSRKFDPLFWRLQVYSESDF